MEAAIGYLEEHAAFLRRGRNGAAARAGARAGGRRLSPPRLARRRPRPSHPCAWWPTSPRTTRAASGRWTRGRSTAHAKTAGYLYQAELRHQLTHDPRRRVGPGDQGRGRDRGRTEGGTSTPSAAAAPRSTSAWPSAASRGRRAAEVAALDTRPAKDYAVLGQRSVRRLGARARASSASAQRQLEATLWRGQEREPEPASSSRSSTSSPARGPDRRPVHLHPRRGAARAVRARRP